MDDVINMNYNTQIVVKVDAKKAFIALTKNIHKWWSSTSKSDQKKGGQFTIQFDNGYWWTFNILEFTPYKKIVWECIDGEPDFNKEWIGHILQWELIKKDTELEINFHQIGLTPKVNCYEVCSKTWDMFITEKLRNHLQSNT